MEVNEELSVDNENVAKNERYLKSFHCLQDIKSLNFVLLKNRLRSLDVTFAMVSFVGKYLHLEKSLGAFLC